MPSQPRWPRSAARGPEGACHGACGSEGRPAAKGAALRRLQARNLAEIARLADEIDVPDGYGLIKEGTLGQQFVMIVEGTVRIDQAGRTLRRMGPGEFLGEIALIDRRRTTASATAEGPARLLVMSGQAFHSLLDQSPSIRLAVLTALAERVRSLAPGPTL